MSGWPDRRALALLGIEVPIVQAPMAGCNGSALAIAVARAGGLGSLPCALLSGEQVRAEVAAFRAATARPINLNFFCHQSPDGDEGVERWRRRLHAYYVELGVDPAAAVAGGSRAPVVGGYCRVVEELRAEVVSFHFGLPEAELLARVRASGAKILSSATTVDEAVWLEAQGCDAIIAQGFEAGGHRGMFRTRDVATQVGTMALVPQVVDAVRVPVIAAGGIADARGIVAAFALGAAAMQLGTAYLRCPEATTGARYRQALRDGRDDGTAITNVFTGRPARGLMNRAMRELGPMSTEAPPFPLASGALLPLRARAEAAGSDDFTWMWAGQAARLGRELPAEALTRVLVSEALARLG
jgi:nitronate monooxygenase